MRNAATVIRVQEERYVSMLWAVPLALARLIRQKILELAMVCVSLEGYKVCLKVI